MTSRSLRDVLEGLGVLASDEVFRADLHAHSTVSDGSYTFAELLDQAKEQGLSHIAFTNHDTTHGLAEAARLADGSGVRAIGGIEISAYDFERGRKVHVLGLGLSEDAPAIAALCTPTLEKRDANTRWQLEQIIRAGYDVDMEAFERLSSASTCAYKQHVMAALIDEPYGTPAYKALYNALFKGGGIADRDIEYVDARDAVRAIVEDGGLPVLAHPGQMDSWDFVPELVSCGLAGIEKYHHDHTAADEAHAQELAHRFGLFVTGGSDYHGVFGKPKHLGERWIEG